MTLEEMELLRTLIREESRTAVREEVRTAVREEVRTVVHDEVRTIVQEELKPVNERLDRLEARVDGLETRMSRLETETRQTRVLVEAQRHEIQIIAEQYGDIALKLERVGEIDDLRSRVRTLETVVRNHSATLRELKRAE